MGVLLNEDKFYMVNLTLTPAQVAANTTAEQTFTLTNLKTGDFILDVIKPSTQAGLGITGYRVSAANTLAITFSNNTGSPITPTAGEVYQVGIIRPEKTYSNIPA